MLARLLPALPALIGMALAAVVFAILLPREIAGRVAAAERTALEAYSTLQRSLGTLSVGLTSLQRSVQDGEGPASIDPTLTTALHRDLPSLRGLLVIDASGVVRDDTRPGRPAIGMDVSDRAYFRALAPVGGPDRFFMATADARTDATPTFAMVSAIRDPSGALSGTVVASVNAGVFGIASPRSGTVPARLLLHLHDTGTWIALDSGDLASEPGRLSDLAERLDAHRVTPGDTLLRTQADGVLIHTADLQDGAMHVVALTDRGALTRAAVLEASMPPALLAVGGLALSLTLIATRRRHRRDAMHTAALQDANERLELSTRGAGIGIWDWDMRSGSFYWSPVLCDLLGVAPTGSPNDKQTVDALIAPEDHARVRAAVDDHIQHGRPYDIEFDMIRADGGRLTLSNRGEARFDPEGRPVRMVGTAHDVTARRSLETRLLEAEIIARLGYWTLDPATGATSWSPGVFRLHGLDPGAASPDRDAWLDFFLPEDRDTIRRRLDHAALACRESTPDASILGPDGQLRRVRLTIRVSADGNGRAQRIFGIIEDRSEAVQAARELEKAQRFDAFGQLAGGVAHDFNNLLAVMLGNLELLEQQEGARLTEDSRACLQQVIASITRGRDLTQSLLSFARTAPLRPETTNPAQTLDELETLLRRTLPASITLDMRHDSDDWAIHVDRGALGACLLNLAINARDAMDGAGHMTIAARKRRLTADGDGWPTALDRPIEPGPYVAFEVRDTGRGIDPAALPMVFEPFFTTKPVGAGSGLGLSRVKGFAEQSGGAVDLHSTPGQGTTVSILLPAATRSDASDQHTTLAPAKRREDGAELLRILVVEDTSAVRRVLARQLRHMGFDVTAAATGDEAAALIEGGAVFDLLLTDLVMPGTLQGAAVALLARERHPGMAVLLMSGYADEALPPALETAPRLTKPVSMQDLELAIGRILQAGKADSVTA